MSDPRVLVTRRISALLAHLSTEEPVIALHGPRAVGKSTVLRLFAQESGVEVIDLDDLETRDAVAGNLTTVVQGPIPLCIDEYQYAPTVLDALKARMNREGTSPGLAVITGSTRQDALPRTAQALTGRLHTLTIWPLSQGELEGSHENLLETLHSSPDAVPAQHPKSVTTRADYVNRVCSGGMPLALTRTEPSRQRWFANYIRQSVERDALELARIHQRQALGQLLQYSAATTGQLLNISALAEQLGLDRKTGENYLRLLEDLFLVLRLPAWGKTLRSRVTSKPKAHLVDSGLAAHLLGLTPEKLVGVDPTSLTQFGNLLETFVVTELFKQASWLPIPPTLGHWRTSDGAEVDLVAEFHDGGVVAFEVKASERASGPNFTGLQQLRDRIGPHFRAGVMFTTGRRSYTYEDRIHVLPIDRLWRHNET